MDYSFSGPLKSEISKRLDSFPTQTHDNPALKAAAVSLVVTKCLETADAAVFLTLRSSKIRAHTGQFALPGGRVDKGESIEQAALRELHEEMGVELGPEAILGRLDDYSTRSGYQISPLVIWGGALRNLNPNPDEVAKVFRIPFHELNSPQIPILTPTEYEHPVLRVHLPTTGGHVAAPTAALLYQFREVCIRGENTRVAHFDQPAFAWK